MKKLINQLVATGFITAMAVTTASAQPVITVDEFGAGTFVAGGVTNTFTGGLGVDPFSGMTTLVYTLPFPAVRGDLVISDVSGTVSDILRFDGNFQLFFYSDYDPTEPITAPADVGFPAAILPNKLFFVESGPEAGPNGLFGYNPGINDPGANTAGVTYNFYSDLAPAPEPGSMALVASGLGIFGLRFWRRR